MERSFATYLAENMKEGYVPGDAAAHRAAAALAERADAPTILCLTDMLALLDRVGGQFYVTSVRIKESALGPDWHAAGVTFDYETRDAKVERLEPPEEVDGMPVTDSSGPGIVVAVNKVEVKAAEQPETEFGASPTGDEEQADPDADPLPEDSPSARASEDTAAVRDRVRRESELAAQEA